MKSKGLVLKLLPWVFFIILFSNSDYFIIRNVAEVSETSWIAAIVLLLVSIIYLYSERKSLTVLTPDKIFFYLYFFMVFPGMFFTTRKGIDHDLVVIVQVLSISLFLFAVMFVRNVKQLKNIDLRLIFKTRIKKAKLERKEILDLFLVVSVILIIIFVATGNFNRSGALSGFSKFFMFTELNDDVDVNAYRSEIYKIGGLGGNFHLVIGNYIAAIILPILGVYFIVEGKKRFKKAIVRYGAFILLLSLVFTMGTGSRLMSMKVLLYVITCYSLLNVINLGKVVRYGFLVFLVLILTTSLLGRGLKTGKSIGESIAENTASAVERIFLVKGIASLIVYDYYPKMESYEHGKTILSSLAGSSAKNENLANKMFYYNTGRLGTAGPQTFGDFYANFGFVWQVVLALVLGLLIALFGSYIIIKVQWSSFTFAIIGYLFLSVGYMGYSEFGSFKAAGFHILLLLFLLYRFLTYKKEVV